MNNFSAEYTCKRCTTVNKLDTVMRSKFESFLDKYRYHIKEQEVQKIQSWIYELESNISEEHHQTETCTRWDNIRR